MLPRKWHIIKDDDKPSAVCENCGRTIIKGGSAVGAPIYKTNPADFINLQVEMRCSVPDADEKAKRITVIARRWR